MLRKSLNIISLCLLVIITIVIFRINENTFLFSDDFLYSFKFNPAFIFDNPANIHYEKIHNVTDYFQSLEALYLNLTGRIVPHGLLQLFLLLPPIVFDIVNTLIFLLLTYLMTIWVLGKDRRNILQLWLLNIMLLYLAFSTIPNLYYPAFSCNYIWTQLIIFIFLIPFRNYLTGTKSVQDSIRFIILIFLLGLIAGDTNEPLIPGVLLAIGCLGLYSYMSTKSIPKWYIAAFSGLLLGYIFLFFAPGNHNRAVYEAQYNSINTGIAFRPDNVLPMIYSGLGSFPAVLLALFTLVRWKSLIKSINLKPVIFLILIFAGTIFALLFAPIFGHRMNVLYVGIIVMVCMYLIAHDKFTTQTVLMIYILLVSPWFITKLASDYNRMKLAGQERMVFEKELHQSKSDSVLVSPRAYSDPVTRENWAKPIATYYGKRFVWVVNELSNQYLAKRKLVKYSSVSGTTQPVIHINAISYLNQNQYDRAIYVSLAIDTLQVKPKDIIITLHSIDISSQILQRLYEMLPLPLRQYFMNLEYSYRPNPYRMFKNNAVFVMPSQNSRHHYDYFRIRIIDHNRRLGDIILSDVDF